MSKDTNKCVRKTEREREKESKFLLLRVSDLDKKGWRMNKFLRERERMFSYLCVCVREIILKFRWPVSLNVCAEKGREKEGVPKTWSSPGERVKWCVCVLYLRCV